MADLATERQHVGDGWQPIIDVIDESLTKLVDEYRVLQIKEKFGGLRFYIDLPDSLSADAIEAVYEIVHRGEAASFLVCEECGQIGECKASLTGWLKTLCPTHWDERDERDKKWRKERSDG